MNQRPTLFSESPRGTGKRKRPNDLSDQAAMTIKMANAVVKLRDAVEAKEAVILSPEEGRMLLVAIRTSIDRAKTMEKRAREANERASRAGKRK